MAEGLDRAGRAQPGRGGWPAWLDEDDFDSLGKNAWLAAMESLAEEGPEPECPPERSCLLVHLTAYRGLSSRAEQRH